jgi:hypothetical protein
MAGRAVYDAPPPEEESPPIPRPLLWLLELFPGLIRPRVLLMSIVTLVLAAFVMGLATMVFMMGAVFSGFFIGAAAVVMYWSAMAWLLYGYVCMPAEALAEFDSTRWLVFVILTVAPIGALLWHVKSLRAM